MMLAWQEYYDIRSHRALKPPINKQTMDSEWLVHCYFNLFAINSLNLVIFLNKHCLFWDAIRFHHRSWACGSAPCSWSRCEEMTWYGFRCCFDRNRRRSHSVSDYRFILWSSFIRLFIHSFTSFFYDVQYSFIHYLIVDTFIPIDSFIPHQLAIHSSYVPNCRLSFSPCLCLR